MLFVQFYRELNIFRIFNFFNISPIVAEQKDCNIERGKSHLGTWRGFISSTPNERARFLLQITAIKFLGYIKYKFRAPNKSDPTVKTRTFLSRIQKRKINKVLLKKNSGPMFRQKSFLLQR